MAEDDIITITLKLDPGSVGSDAASAAQQITDAVRNALANVDLGKNLNIKPDTAKQAAKVFQDGFDKQARSIGDVVSKSLEEAVIRSNFGKNLWHSVREAASQSPEIIPPTHPAARATAREPELPDLAKRIQPVVSGIEAFSMLLRGAPLLSVAQMAGQAITGMQQQRREPAPPPQLIGGRPGESESMAVERRLRTVPGAPPPPEGGGPGLAGTAAEGGLLSGMAGRIGIGVGAIAGLTIALNKAAQAVADLGNKGAETALHVNDMSKTMGMSVEQFLTFQEYAAKAGINTDDYGRAIYRLAVSAKEQLPIIERQVAQEANTATEANIKVNESERALQKTRDDRILSADRVLSSEGELAKVEVTGAERREELARAAQLGVSGAQIGARGAAMQQARAGIQLQLAPQEQALADVQGPLTVEGAKLGRRGAELAAGEARARFRAFTTGEQEDPDAVARRNFARERLKVDTAEHNLKQAEVQERKAQLEESRRQAMQAAGLGPVGQAQQEALQAAQNKAQADLRVRQSQTAEVNLAIEQAYTPLAAERNKALAGVNQSVRDQDTVKDTQETARITKERAVLDRDRLKYEQVGTVQRAMQAAERGEPQPGYDFREVPRDVQRAALVRQGGGTFEGMEKTLSSFMQALKAQGVDQTERLRTMQALFPQTMRGVQGGVAGQENLQRLLETPKEGLSATRQKEIHDTAVEIMKGIPGAERLLSRKGELEAQGRREELRTEMTAMPSAEGVNEFNAALHTAAENLKQFGLGKLGALPGVAEEERAGLHGEEAKRRRFELDRQQKEKEEKEKTAEPVKALPAPTEAVPGQVKPVEPVPGQLKPGEKPPTTAPVGPQPTPVPGTVPIPVQPVSTECCDDIKQLLKQPPKEPDKLKESTDQHKKTVGEAADKHVEASSDVGGALKANTGALSSNTSALQSLHNEFQQGKISQKDYLERLKKLIPAPPPGVDIPPPTTGTGRESGGFKETFPGFWMRGDMPGAGPSPDIPGVPPGMQLSPGRDFWRAPPIPGQPSIWRKVPAGTTVGAAKPPVGAPAGTAPTAAQAAAAVGPLPTPSAPQTVGGSTGPFFNTDPTTGQIIYPGFENKTPEERAKASAKAANPLAYLGLDVAGGRTDKVTGERTQVTQLVSIATPLPVPVKVADFSMNGPLPVELENFKLALTDVLPVKVTNPWCCDKDGKPSEGGDGGKGGGTAPGAKKEGSTAPEICIPGPGGGGGGGGAPGGTTSGGGTTEQAGGGKKPGASPGATGSSAPGASGPGTGVPGPVAAPPGTAKPGGTPGTGGGVGEPGTGAPKPADEKRPVEVGKPAEAGKPAGTGTPAPTGVPGTAPTTGPTVDVGVPKIQSGNRGGIKVGSLEEMKERQDLAAKIRASGQAFDAGNFTTDQLREMAKHTEEQRQHTERMVPGQKVGAEGYDPTKETQTGVPPSAERAIGTPGIMPPNFTMVPSGRIKQIEQEISSAKKVEQPEYPKIDLPQTNLPAGEDTAGTPPSGVTGQVIEKAPKPDSQGKDEKAVPLKRIETPDTRGTQYAPAPKGTEKQEIYGPTREGNKPVNIPPPPAVPKIEPTRPPAPSLQAPPEAGGKPKSEEGKLKIKPGIDLTAPGQWPEIQDYFNPLSPGFFNKDEVKRRSEERRKQEDQQDQPSQQDQSPLPPIDIPPMAAGGPVGGWGGPKSDSVPIMASKGEFVVTADGSNLGDAIQHFKGNGYADGGEVGGLSEEDWHKQATAESEKLGESASGRAIPIPDDESMLKSVAPEIAASLKGMREVEADPHGSFEMLRQSQQATEDQKKWRQEHGIPVGGYADGGEVDTNKDKDKPKIPDLSGIGAQVMSAEKERFADIREPIMERAKHAEASQQAYTKLSQAREQRQAKEQAQVEKQIQEPKPEPISVKPIETYRYATDEEMGRQERTKELEPIPSQEPIKGELAPDETMRLVPRDDEERPQNIPSVSEPLPRRDEEDLAEGGFVGGRAIDTSHIFASLVRGFAGGGMVGGFTNTVAHIPGYANGGSVASPSNGSNGNSLGYHQLDLRTSAGTFSANVNDDTMGAIRNSSLSSKLSSTGARPSWYS